jgi:hypothetical protein
VTGDLAPRVYVVALAIARGEIERETEQGEGGGGRDQRAGPDDEGRRGRRGRAVGGEE